MFWRHKLSEISKNNQKNVYDNNAKLIKEINDLYHSLQQNGKSDSVISNITELDSLIINDAAPQTHDGDLVAKFQFIE